MSILFFILNLDMDGIQVLKVDIDLLFSFKYDGEMSRNVYYYNGSVFLFDVLVYDDKFMVNGGYFLFGFNLFNSMGCLNGLNGFNGFNNLLLVMNQFLFFFNFNVDFFMMKESLKLL